MIQRFCIVISSFLLIFLMHVFASCSNENSKKSGSLRLNEKQMTAIIKDVQVAEGIINYSRNQGRNNDDNKNEYFDLIFQHHKITPEILRENIAFYSQTPEIMDRIYDTIIQQLKSAQDSLKLEESKKNDQEKL